jgi:predicted nucleic acid-binding protein
MRAVSNTSPLSNLAIIDRLDLLRQRYGVVFVPPAVSNELSRLSNSAAQVRLANATSEGWLKVEMPAIAPPKLPFPLDLGETEAVTLPLSMKADVLLIDEKRGRIAARSVGLTVAGILGELARAKLAGILPALKPELEALRREAGFFIDSEIEKFILSAAGE